MFPYIMAKNDPREVVGKYFGRQFDNLNYPAITNTTQKACEEQELVSLQFRRLNAGKQV